ADRSPGLGTHVAVLAGDSLPGGGRGLVFAEGLFQSESIDQGHVVTAAAEAGLGDEAKLDRVSVDGASLLLGIGDHTVLIGVGEHALQLFVALGAVDRIEDAPLDERLPA